MLTTSPHCTPNPPSVVPPWRTTVSPDGGGNGYEVTYPPHLGAIIIHTTLLLVFDGICYGRFQMKYNV